MTLIFGKTSLGLLVPVAVDVDGNLQVELLAGSVEIGSIQARSHGWRIGAWKKDPIRFGFSAQQGRAWGNTSLPAGNSNVDDTAVPADTLWVITNYAFRYTGTAPTRVNAIMVSGGTTFIIFAQAAPVSALTYDRQTNLIMKPGAFLRLSVVGATVNDDLEGWGVGYEIDINQ